MDENNLPEQVEEMARLQFSDEEIATIVELRVDDLLATYQLNIDRGRLQAEAEVRKSILKLAKSGSTPAQKQFMDLNYALKRQNKRK